METPESLGIIAGNGVYPLLVAQAARRAGVGKLFAAAFTGETDPQLAQHVDDIAWMRVGQLGRLLSSFRDGGFRHAIMAGQITPTHLFDLRPDWKAILLLARLKHRNAESIFSAIADELAAVGVELLPAYSFIEDLLAPNGPIAGPALTRRQQADVAFGLETAREMSRLDIGQTVVVKNGAVLAVEAFEGTNEAMRRGGALARKDAVVAKVAKAGQDFRFDVPVIGAETLRTAAQAHIRVIVVEAGRTLLLEKDEIVRLAAASKISVVGQ